MNIWGTLLYAGCCCGYPGIDRAEITGVSLDPLSQGNLSRDLTGRGESQVAVREGIFQVEGGNDWSEGWREQFQLPDYWSLPAVSSSFSLSEPTWKCQKDWRVVVSPQPLRAPRAWLSWAVVSCGPGQGGGGGVSTKQTFWDHPPPGVWSPMLSVPKAHALTEAHLPLSPEHDLLRGSLSQFLSLPPILPTPLSVWSF